MSDRDRRVAIRRAITSPISPHLCLPKIIPTTSVSGAPYSPDFFMNFARLCRGRLILPSMPALSASATMPTDEMARYCQRAAPRADTVRGARRRVDVDSIDGQRSNAGIARHFRAIAGQMDSATDAAMS